VLLFTMLMVGAAGMGVAGVFAALLLLYIALQLLFSCFWWCYCLAAIAVYHAYGAAIAVYHADGTS
jgi:hypothetical protein